MNKFVLSSLIVVASGLVCLPSSADEQRSGERGERRGPPPEAFEACANLSENSTCEVQTRSGREITGQCRVPHHRRQNADSEVAEQLLCVPERRIRRRSENELT